MTEELSHGQHSNLMHLCELLHKFQMHNFDCITAVTGFKGVGKSTFAMNVIRFMRHKYGGHAIDNVPLEGDTKCIAYNNEDVKSCIQNLEKYGIFMADEAARFAMGEDWMHTENKELKKLLAQCRSPKNLIAMLCIPNMNWFDSKYLEGLISIWIWIPARGHAFIFLPDANPSADPWHMEFFKKNVGYLNMLTPIETIEKMVRKHPCFQEHITFPDCPEDLYARYEELRTANTTGELIGNATTQKELATIALYNIYTNWPGFKAAVEGQHPGRYPSLQRINDALFLHPKTKKLAQPVRQAVNHLNAFAKRNDIPLAGRGALLAKEEQPAPSEEPELVLTKDEQPSPSQSPQDEDTPTG